jgi:hypothetical protein
MVFEISNVSVKMFEGVINIRRGSVLNKQYWLVIE